MRENRSIIYNAADNIESKHVTTRERSILSKIPQVTSIKICTAAREIDIYIQQTGEHTAEKVLSLIGGKTKDNNRKTSIVKALFGELLIGLLRNSLENYYELKRV